MPSVKSKTQPTLTISGLRHRCFCSGRLLSDIIPLPCGLIYDYQTYSTLWFMSNLSICRLRINAVINIRPRVSTNPRCPHLLFGKVFGAGRVAELLEYVSARQRHFESATVRNRQSGLVRVDVDRRDCLNHAGLGPFQGWYHAFIRSIQDTVLEQLHLKEPAVEPSEFEFSAYRDGGHFAPHVDTGDRIRIVSCVYYFAARPRPFAGGELRLHGLPGVNSDAPPFVDIEPESDTLIAFPSWMPHEVRPVRVSSAAWADSRFTVNCWIQRVRTAHGKT